MACGWDVYVTRQPFRSCWRPLRSGNRRVVQAAASTVKEDVGRRAALWYGLGLEFVPRECYP